MIHATNIDVSGLGRLINGLHNALIGSGQNGDLTEVTKDETRRLSMECGRPPTARQRKRLEGGIRRDIGSVFLQMPAQPFTGSKRHGENMEWLAAGPNFLMGVTPAHLITQNEVLAGGGLKLLLYNLRGNLPKEKYTTLGTRGKQKVITPNRLVIARGAMSKLFNDLKKRVGIRDASFVETAAKLGESKITATTRKHFPTKHSITQLGGLAHPENPSITFGSNAKGVKGLVPKVNRAVKVRQHKMAYRLRKILTGYAADNNSGGVIRHHGKATHES